VLARSRAHGAAPLMLDDIVLGANAGSIPPCRCVAAHQVAEPGQRARPENRRLIKAGWTIWKFFTVNTR